MDQEYIEISKKYLNCSFWEQTQDCEIHNYGNKLHVQNNQVCLNQMSRGSKNETKPKGGYHILQNIFSDKYVKLI